MSCNSDEAVVFGLLLENCVIIVKLIEQFSTQPPSTLCMCKQCMKHDDSQETRDSSGNAIILLMHQTFALANFNVIFLLEREGKRESFFLSMYFLQL